MMNSKPARKLAPSKNRGHATVECPGAGHPLQKGQAMRKSNWLPTGAFPALQGQAAVEFMFTTFIILLLLGMAVSIYATSVDSANKLKSALEANQVCISAASALSSLSFAGGSMDYSFRLPKYVNGENYTVYVIADKQIVKVDYGKSAGEGCSIPLMAISNSSGATFFILQKNATAQFSNGVVTIVP
jgi:hypothetical protein